MKLIARKLSLCATASFLAFILGPAAHETLSRPAAKPVTAEFKNADGQPVGTATLSEAAHGVKIKLDVKGLPPGDHSIHIHQVAKCDPPDFKSAGPHFSPATSAGHDHSAMPAGDIPDFMLIIAADGTAHVSVVAPNVSMGDEANSVFSNGGTSIVIHAVAAPGSSGSPARIACAVVKKAE